MYVGMLPTWGDKWNLKWGVGPEIFTPENAEEYGRWLGERYADKPIIWILGGDRPVDSDQHRMIIHAMAQGIKQGDGGRHLMTFHPSGRRNSADDFHDAEWLDFNMIQSGHSRPAPPNFEVAIHNLSLKPLKPTLDGEPCYEDHPVKNDKWERRNEPGILLDWYDEWHVRIAAYGSMLAGACGHTYGDHNVWQMWLPHRPAKSVARTPWHLALDHPGSQQMKYFRNVFEARPFWKLHADQSLIAGENPPSEFQIRSAVADQSAFALVYLPVGGEVAIQVAGLSWKGYMAWWFNPRQNSSQLIGEWKRSPTRTFKAPTSGRNNDWLLVLDSVNEDLPRLGYSHQHLMPVVQQ